MSKYEGAKGYFDFMIWRLAFASGSHWKVVQFIDGSQWSRLALGFYWRTSA